MWYETNWTFLNNIAALAVVFWSTELDLSPQRQAIWSEIYANVWTVSIEWFRSLSGFSTVYCIYSIYKYIVSNLETVVAVEVEGESPITMYWVLITARYIVSHSVMWSFSACFTTGMKKITQKAPDERVLIRYWRQLISFLPYSVTFPLELLSHYVFLAGCWSNQIHSTSPL